MTDRLLDWLMSLPPTHSYVILMIFSALENVFPPIPADVAVALGAFLSQRLGRSVVPLGLLCWMANTATSIGMYALARAYGVGFFRTGWRRRLLPPQAMTAIETAYARHGVLGIFLSRFLPGIRAGVTPFAGVCGMPAFRALVPAVLASGIWYTLIVAAASMLGLEWNAIRRLIENVNNALGIAALVVILAIVLWLIVRARSRNSPSSSNNH